MCVPFMVQTRSRQYCCSKNATASEVVAQALPLEGSTTQFVHYFPLGGSEQIREEGADHSYWWNAALRESSLVKPLAFEEGLVGTRVWLTRPTSAGLTGQGRITR